MTFFVKLLMQITFDDWQRAFKGARNQLLDEFEEYRRFGEKIVGGPIGHLTLADIISKVLVEASHRELDEEDQRTDMKMRKRLQKDLASRHCLTHWKRQILIAESESLIMKSHEGHWTPPSEVPDIANPYFGRRDPQGDKRRRQCAKYILYCLVSGRKAQEMAAHGFPACNPLDFGLSILCLSPTEIDKDPCAFIVSDEAPSLKDNSGTVTKMLASFTKKMRSFRSNYEFLDITEDLRNGTRTKKELVTSYIDRMVGENTAEGDGNEAGEGNGRENGEEGEEGEEGENSD